MRINVDGSAAGAAAGHPAPGGIETGRFGQRAKKSGDARMMNASYRMTTPNYN